MKYKKLILTAAIVLTVTLVIFKSINAQNPAAGMTVYPINFDITQNPDKASAGKITVKNNTSQTMEIRVDLRNFTAQGEEGSVELTTEDIAYSLAKWITVEPMNATIRPNTTREFSFTITPPANAEPGGHFGSVVFATVPSANAEQGSAAAVSQEVASLILFKIPGDVIEQAIIESFTTDKSFYEFGPVVFDTRVKNEGGVHITPSGAIVVKGWFGQSFTTPLEMRNVLPNAVRKIPATLENNWLFGPYTATLIAAYGTKNQQLNASTQFFAFPVRYGLVALGIIVILFLMRKRIGKSLKILLTGK